MRALAGVNEDFLRRTAGLAPHEAARVAAFSLWGSVWFAGLLLAARRLVGAMTAPLEPVALLFAAGAFVAIAAAGRLCWQRGEPRRSHAAEGEHACCSAERPRVLFLYGGAAERAARWAPALGLLLVGLGLWLPQTSPWAVAGFWTLVVVEESWAAAERRFRRASPAAIVADSAPVAAPEGAETDAPAPFSAAPFVSTDAEAQVAPNEAEPRSSAPALHLLAGPHFLPPPPAAPLPPGKRDLPHIEPAAPHFALERLTESEAEQTDEPEETSEPLSADEQLVQQLTRTVTAAGAELLRATLYASFPAGSRTTSVHVAFCPPFPSLPRAEFHQAAGPAARIKLAQLLAHGARFDVKLSSPAAEAETVCIQLTAAWGPSES